MRTSWWSCGVLVLALAVGACGGRRGGGGGDDDDDDDVGGGSSSGLTRSAQVGDLDEADVQTLCEWGADRQGGEGATHECGESITITVPPVSECAGDLYGTSCDITVGEVEDCLNDIAPDPCLMLEATPPSCMPMLQCGQAGA